MELGNSTSTDVRSTVSRWGLSTKKFEVQARHMFVADFKRAGVPGLQRVRLDVRGDLSVSIGSGVFCWTLGVRTVVDNSFIQPYLLERLEMLNHCWPYQLRRMSQTSGRGRGRRAAAHSGRPTHSQGRQHGEYKKGVRHDNDI